MQRPCHPVPVSPGAWQRLQMQGGRCCYCGCRARTCGLATERRDDTHIQYRVSALMSQCPVADWWRRLHTAHAWRVIRRSLERASEFPEAPNRGGHSPRHPAALQRHAVTPRHRLVALHALHGLAIQPWEQQRHQGSAPAPERRRHHSLVPPCCKCCTRAAHPRAQALEVRRAKAAFQRIMSAIISVSRQPQEPQAQLL